MIELFFANDEGQYMELEVSPRGRYQYIFLDQYKNEVLTTVPVYPQGVTELGT